jgi:hypothetical protein
MRHLDRSRFAILAAAVLVLGHELVLRIGYGPGADASIALKATSHGLAWILQAVAALLATGGLALVVLARIRRLRNRLTQQAAAIPALSRPSRRELLGLWERLFAVALIGFVVQENVEHGLLHGHLPGLSMLYGGQYVFTIPVFVLLSLAAALLGATLHRELATLEASVAALDRSLPRPVRLITPLGRDPQPRSRALLLSAAVPRRGPPTLVRA